MRGNGPFVSLPLFLPPSLPLGGTSRRQSVESSHQATRFPPSQERDDDQSKGIYVECSVFHLRPMKIHTLNDKCKAIGKNGAPFTGIWGKKPFLNFLHKFTKALRERMFIMWYEGKYCGMMVLPVINSSSHIVTDAVYPKCLSDIRLPVISIHQSLLSVNTVIAPGVTAARVFLLGPRLQVT